jgi:hypothetical protein
MNKKIDIDKYEGHDLAKGRVGSDYNIYDRKGNIIFDADDVGSNMATLNLLADAPLLLEEYNEKCEEVWQLKKRIAEVGSILDSYRICDECGKYWDDHADLFHRGFCEDMGDEEE